MSTAVTADLASSRMSTLTEKTVIQQEGPPFTFVRALYDYHPDPPSTAALSFKKDDVLEVVGRLESGWWDGFLGDKRGWFPSNYVVGISEEEAEVLLDPSDWAETSNGSTNYDRSEDEEWHSFSRDGDQSWTGTESTGDPIDTTPNAHAEPSDFWMPEVTSTGQARYLSSYEILRSVILILSSIDILREYPYRPKITRFTCGYFGIRNGPRCRSIIVIFRFFEIWDHVWIRAHHHSSEGNGEWKKYQCEPDGNGEETCWH